MSALAGPTPWHPSLPRSSPLPGGILGPTPGGQLAVSSTDEISSSTHSARHWGYRSYRDHLAERFGERRIRKLCLDAGFTCPNLDGTLARGGCAYCNNRGFVPDGPRSASLLEQWDRGRCRLRRRHHRVDGFIAYFQAYTNTHAPLPRLREVYAPLPDSLAECVGVSISTRPDCLSEPVLELLTDLARRTFLTVELGLQSDRDAVLRDLNRAHDAACFSDAVSRASGRGFELCAHLMLGLPGEGADAPERLGDLLAGLPVQSVKIHNLLVLRGTALATAFRAGRIHVPDREEWPRLVARCLARLRSDQAVQRCIADAPESLMLSSPWCLDKQAFLRALRPQLQCMQPANTSLAPYEFVPGSM